MAEDVLLSERRGRVLVLTMNRPDARNAINDELAHAISEACDALDADDGLSIGVLTGAGRGFCSGMDLKAFVEGSGSQVKGKGFGGMTQRPPAKPMIAAVEGFAVAGGFELALACDLIVASKGAKLGIPEVKRGLVAGGGGLMRLPRQLPYAMAMELALTGDTIPAERAHELGLVSRLVEPGDALVAATELAEHIAENAPLALRATKAALAGSIGRTDEEYWAFQAPLLGPVFSSSDAIEGATAFAEKRPPRWTGT